MSDVVIAVHAIKGRGAATRLAHRFEKNQRTSWDDGWGTLEADADADAAEDNPTLETELSFEDARSAIVRNDSPDIFFDYSLNPYRGCINNVRGGKHYNSDSASRLKGSGLWADLIKQRFEKTCHRLGFNRQRVKLDLGQFRPSAQPSPQASLF